MTSPVTAHSPEEFRRLSQTGQDAVLQRIAEKSLICYRCAARKADMPIALVCDMPHLSGIPKGMRVLWTGICLPCELFSSNNEKLVAAETLFRSLLDSQ